MAEISQDKTKIAEKDSEIARLNTLIQNQEMTINILSVSNGKELFPLLKQIF